MIMGFVANFFMPETNVHLKQREVNDHMRRFVIAVMIKENGRFKEKYAAVDILV